MAKMTLRLPDPVAESLRARSRESGRSLNDTAVDAILRGLGEPAPEAPWRALGALVQVPPSEHFDPERLKRCWRAVGQAARGLLMDLEWVRADRL